MEELDGSRRMRYELEGSVVLPPISFSQDDSSGAQRPRKKQRREESVEPPSTMFTQECSLVARTREDRERMLVAMPEMADAFETGESYRSLKREHSRIKEDERKRRDHEERLAEIKRRFPVDESLEEPELPRIPSLPSTPKVRSADDSAFVSDGLVEEESSEERLDRLLRGQKASSPIKLLALPTGRDEPEESCQETFTALRALFTEDAAPVRVRKLSPVPTPVLAQRTSTPKAVKQRPAARPPRIILASETPPKLLNRSPIATSPEAATSPVSPTEPESFHLPLSAERIHSFHPLFAESMPPPPISPLRRSPQKSPRTSPRSSEKKQAPSPLRQVFTVEPPSPSPARISRRPVLAAETQFDGQAIGEEDEEHPETLALRTAPVEPFAPVAGPSRIRADFSERLAAAWGRTELEAPSESIEDSAPPRQKQLDDFFETQPGPATRARQAALTSALVESITADRRRIRRSPIARALQRVASEVDETQLRLPTLGTREDVELFGPLNEAQEIIEEAAEEREPTPMSIVEDTQVLSRPAGIDDLTYVSPSRNRKWKSMI